MKKFLVLFIISFSLGILLMPFNSYAKSTSMSAYYPSPSGNYTKIHLVNSTPGGPDENSVSAPFCRQNPVLTYPAPGATGVTWSNAGTIFADPNTGYLEACKTDGSVASFPGTCFNRFGSSVASPACPNNYIEVNPAKATNTFNINAATAIVSWTCCFTGQTSGPNAASISRSGCFSIYSNSSTTMALCSDVDPNAYDVGCDTISSTTASEIPNPIYKRNCCFNATAGGTLKSSTSNASCNPNSVHCTYATNSPGPTTTGTYVCEADLSPPTCGGASAIGTINPLGYASSSCVSDVGTGGCTTSPNLCGSSPPCTPLVQDIRGNWYCP